MNGATLRKMMLGVGVPAGLVAAAVAWHFHASGQITPSQDKAPPAASVTPAAGVLRYEPDAPQLTLVKTEPVQRGPVPVSDTLNARVVYDEDATVRLSPSLAGRVVAVGAAPGDTVRAGQMLLELDAPDLGAAQADLEKARADELRKRQTLDRARDLAPGEAVAARDVEAAQADLAQAHAETVRAEQRLRNLNPRGATIVGQRLRLLSPIAGVVTERNINLAAEYTPGQGAALFVVSDPKRVWLSIDLPERLLSVARPGVPIEVDSDAWPGQRFEGRLAQAGSVVDPNTRRVTLRAVMSHPDGRLLPEMFVRARLLQSTGEGVRVRNEALISRGVQQAVFVQTGQGEFRRVPVSLATQGSEFSVVSQGLQGHERVVTTGALLLDAELNAAATVRR